MLSKTIAASITQIEYQVLERQVQTRDNFVQGLEIFNHKLYLSSGGYGKSILRKYDLESGNLELQRSIAPNYFAEGLTILNNRLYLLSWRARIAMIFDPENFNLLSSFRIPGDGWGMTNDGDQLIYSDGTHRLYFLDPMTLKITRTISVFENGRRTTNLNELEYINKKIWANIWLTNKIVVIDPETGYVSGFLDLTKLAKEVRANSNENVLNGIALDPNNEHIWITGKKWPLRFKIEISEVVSSSLKKPVK